jgi:general secretion pathway protein N
VPLVEVQPRRAIFQGSGGESTLDLRIFGGAPQAEKTVIAGNSAVAVKPAVEAAASATKDAADAAPISIEEAARIQAIRQRIEARRAQIAQQQ